MQSGPGFRKDLNVVIVAPDGGFVFLPVLRLPADAPPLGLATTLVT